MSASEPVIVVEDLERSGVTVEIFGEDCVEAERRARAAAALRLFPVLTRAPSVRLLEAGFDVVSCDGSAQMLYRAFENLC